MTITVQRFFLAGFVLVVSAIALWVLPENVLADEWHHWPQIQRFVHGQWIINPSITVIPGYHALVALLLNLTGGETLTFARVMNVLICWPSVVITYLITRHLHNEVQAPIRSLQYFLCPAFFPFFFLVYTDIFGLFIVMVAFLLALAGRPNWSGAAVIAAFLVRQTTIVWGSFFAWMTITNATHQGKPTASSWGRKLLMFAAAASLSFGFFVINGGVAIGDAESHQASVNPTQVFFALVFLFVALLPLQVRYFARVFQLFRKPMVSLGVIAGFVGLISIYDTGHPYNSNVGELSLFLRNNFIAAVNQSPPLFITAYFAAVWALLTLCVMPLKSTRFYAVYPLSIIALLPSDLIETRYYLIPLFFVLVLRKPETPMWEHGLVAYYAVTTLLLFGGIAAQRVFP